MQETQKYDNKRQVINFKFPIKMYIQNSFYMFAFNHNLVCMNTCYGPHSTLEKRALLIFPREQKKYIVSRAWYSEDEDKKILQVFSF